MDYIEQVEKIYKYFELALNADQKQILSEVKKKFKNDFNLTGCFLKDFITIKENGIIPEDEEIYDRIVIIFENGNIENLLNEMKEFSKYYLMIVFEDCPDLDVLCAMTTINCCYAVECYAILMELMYKHNHKIINDNYFYDMLKLITDIVIERFDNPQKNYISIYDLVNEKTVERLVS